MTEKNRRNNCLSYLRYLIDNSLQLSSGTNAT